MTFYCVASRPRGGETSYTTTCSTAGEMSAVSGQSGVSAGSCCSSITHSPSCGSSCPDRERPQYLDIKPLYVRDVAQEHDNVYREYRTRVSGPPPRADSTCSSQPDNVHQQLLNILSSASKLPTSMSPVSPVTCKRNYSFDHSYDNQSSDSSGSPEHSYKGWLDNRIIK